MDQRTKKIICIFAIVLIMCSCLPYGYILYDSHVKGTNGEAYDIKVQNNYLMFVSDMSSSIKIDEIESVQFYHESIPERNSIKIGTETSEFLTGKTSLKNIGNCYAYVYKNKEYNIKLVAESRIYIFNLYSKDDAINLYNELCSYLS